MLRRTLFSVAILILVSTISYAQLSNYQSAVGVLGQTDFVSKTSGTSDYQLSGPNGVAVDPTTGKVFVVDRSNHRILRWSSTSAATNGSKAEAVFGQADFTTKTTGTTAAKFNNPIGIHIDNNGRMWVGDFSNNRVLRFDNASSKTSGSNADGVLGQSDFTTGTAGVTASKLSGPCGIMVDNKGNLWVSEFNNHRVTKFANAAGKTNGASADAVLGQPDFTTNASGLTSAKMANPNALFVDRDGRLWVSDYGNNRYLRFDAAAGKANGADANGVLGQPNFTTKTAATTKSGSGTTRFIWGDNFGRIYCVQEDNHRILVYENGAAKANGADADFVLGQPDFTTKTVLTPATAASFNVPRAMTVDNVTGNIWVADYSNNRVLRFEIKKQFTVANSMSASGVLGQADFVTKTAGSGNNKLNAPNGIAIDPTTGKLFIADRSNHRILRYTSAEAVKNGGVAEAVLGQPDFTTVSSGLTQAKFNNPIGIHVDKAGRLWVGDFSNNRVLRFDNASTKANGASADGVLGQADFVTSTTAASATKVSGPCGIQVDDAGTLWVSEFNNHRVTRFDNAAAKTNGAAADGVLGQPDFTTNASATTAAKMANPNGLFVDQDGRLWVSDYGNNRFSRFNGAAQKANGAEADGVLGQADFTTKLSTTTKNGSGTTRFVWGDAEGRIYLVQESNHRILVYENGAYKSNGADADYVLGQSDFVSKVVPAPPTPSSLNVPRAIAIDNSNGFLWVADYSNNRVLRFDLKQQSSVTKFVSLTSPNGGEDWGKGTKQNITWNSGNVATVKLEYSDDNGAKWNLIGTEDASKQKYEWTLPDITSTTVLVRISDNSNSSISDVSDKVFRIGEVIYSLNVISPNGYQSWGAGSKKNIMFEAKGVANVKIEYSLNNGSTWNSVTNSTPAATGTFNWTLPTAKSDVALIKITGVENPISDVSDKAFSIVTAKPINANDIVFFADSPTPSFYDPSWGFFTAPSTLELINGSKAPVTTKYSLVGNYSIKMNWKSGEKGDWAFAIASDGWVGRDIMQKDTLVLNIFSEIEMGGFQMPSIFLEDTGNKKTARTSLSKYIPWIYPNQWYKVYIPLKWFKDNPGAADLTTIKTIFFGQDVVDNMPNTFYFDDIRLIGGKAISGDQRKVVVVLGSSTAAGTGATSADSAWVGRYRKYMLSKDPDSYLVNLAIGGYTTYDIMASDFAAPSGKPTPKVNNNITKALTYKPTAILINLPSNDANMNFTVTEQMNNMRAITKLAADQKIKVWVTTTQPRNFGVVAQRTNLIQAKDSIIAYYKDKSVDVFTPLANTDGTIKTIYNSGDGVHLNNAGHKVIFDKFVSAKVWETITDIEEIEMQIPTQFAVSQNYPNPFNPTTTIEFALPTASRVDLKIYDVLGQEIATLANTTYSAGTHRVVWDASRLASGMYIYRIVASGDNNSQYTRTLKMMLTK